MFPGRKGGGCADYPRVNLIRHRVQVAGPRVLGWGPVELFYPAQTLTKHVGPTHGGTMTCGMGSTDREMCDT